ncbi:hypothetical protein [Flagellimonas maritima]|nr:hypothetical protein [Allomuricauda aurantiaca]
MINSEINKPLFFSNKEKAEGFSQNLSVIKLLNTKYGSIQDGLSKIQGVEISNKNIQGVANKSVNPTFTIARSHLLNIPKYTISVFSRWSTRHLLSNQCTTGGIDFDNEISSVSVDAGLEIQFFEDPDYKGKLLWISAINEPLYIANLRDLKKEYTRIVDGDLWSGSQCGWACSSWNDKITSVNAYKTSFSSLPRNTSNTCP